MPELVKFENDREKEIVKATVKHVCGLCGKEEQSEITLNLNEESKFDLDEYLNQRAAAAAAPSPYPL